MQTDQSPSREAVEKALDRLRWKLGHVSIDAMEGDNLAVTLCSYFDDTDAEQDENGWSDAATEGCDATLAAIHALYSDAILALLTPATQPDATFRLGDRVEKISGSAWHGRVVGFYSTDLTPEGYAVESERELGSVQIYPVKALRKVEGEPK